MQLLTWNVYFGGHMFEERRDALVMELARRRPEVIALQELTFEHLDALSELGYASTVELGDWSSYGVAIYARVPIAGMREVALPTEMGRSLVTVELGSGLTIATTHLESLDEPDRRIEQIEVIQRRLAAKDRVIWCGDFNLLPESPEQSAIDASWTDAWTALHPNEPGYTVDTDINTMRYQIKEKRTQKRIDRVLARGVTVTSIELVGTKSVDIDGTFVSDHFGLLATIT
ncbi:MAG: endonuclease/exonuclease/phosphatase family protein [Kofleriaceae bacterium]